MTYPATQPERRLQLLTQHVAELQAELLLRRAIDGLVSRLVHNWSTPLEQVQDVLGSQPLLSLHVRMRREDEWRQQQIKIIHESLHGVGRKIAPRLLDEFGSIENLLKANEAQLKAVPGIKAKTAHKILRGMPELAGAYKLLAPR